MARNSMPGVVAKATALFWFHTDRLKLLKEFTEVAAVRGSCATLSIVHFDADSVRCGRGCSFRRHPWPWVDCRANVAKASCLLLETRNNKQAPSEGASDRGLLRPPSVQSRARARRLSGSRRQQKKSGEQLLFHQLSLLHANPAFPLSFSYFPQSPWRQHPSHSCCGDRGQVPDGAGGRGRFGRARAWGSGGGVGGDGRGRAQPGAHAAVGEGARPPLRASRMLLALRRSAATFAPFEEVREHLTFALHADLTPTNKVVVICDETINVFCHLERKTEG